MWTAILFEYDTSRSLKDLPWSPYFLGGFGCAALAVLIYFFS